MPDPARFLTLQEAAEYAREQGRVVLGLLSYDVDREQIRLEASSDMDVQEIDAILKQFGMTFTVSP